MLNLKLSVEKRFVQQIVKGEKFGKHKQDQKIWTKKRCKQQNTDAVCEIKECM